MEIHLNHRVDGARRSALPWPHSVRAQPFVHAIRRDLERRDVEAQPRFWGSTPALRLHRELGQALPFPTHPFFDEQANNTGTSLSAQE